MALMASKFRKAKENALGPVVGGSPNTKSFLGLAAGVLMTAAAILVAMPPAEVAAGQTDYFTTHFFDTNTSATYSVRVLNPVRSTNPLCAMVYVFDSTQTLQECCGCPVRSDQLETFSLANLTGNSFSPPPVSAGSIYVVASAINHGSSAAANGGCDPAAALNPTPALRAWFSNDSQGTSDPFLNSPLDSQEQSRLPSVCSSSVRIGTPAAVCQCGK
jgi:hypothetical protein